MGKPRRPAGKREVVLGDSSLELPQRPQGIRLRWDAPPLNRCDRCPPDVSTGRDSRRKARKAHHRLDDFFGAQCIGPNYLKELGCLLQEVSQHKSIESLTGRYQSPHGFREPEDLTELGKHVHDHLFEGDEAEQLGSALFRFSVTSKARLWGLAYPEAGLIRVTFWDPHHRLGTGGWEGGQVVAAPGWDDPRPSDDGDISMSPELTSSY